MGATFVRANGLQFAVLSDGPPDAPLALLLHGFPDQPGTFRHLLPRLVGAGFRSVAPWMRGYPPTEVPRGRHLDPDVFTADINALHRALGGNARSVLVGHDWGAIAAARAAAAAPDRWRRLVTLAVPPEPVLRAALLDREQLRRSAYLFDALIPGAPRRFGPKRIEALWREWSPGYEPGPDDLDAVRAMVKDRASRRAMLAWYRGIARAALAGQALSARSGVAPQPHLVLHGRDDGCIGASYAERARAVLPNPLSRVEVLDGVGHWLHLEQPDAVGALIVEHLRPALR